MSKKKHISLPTNTNALFELPTDSVSIQSIVSCVRCKKVLDPRLYFICKENEHHVCWVCAGVPPSSFAGSSTSSTSTVPAAGASSSSSLIPLGKCCLPGTLLEGPKHLMDNLLKKSLWECKFKEMGCQEHVLGNNWVSHITNCKFGKFQQCKFATCTKRFFTRWEAVEHLLLHGLKIHEGQWVDINVPYENLKYGRVVRLIHWNDGYYLFAAEIHGKAVHAWIWDMQTIDDKLDSTKISFGFKVRHVSPQPQDPNFLPNTSIHRGNCLPYQVDSSEVISAAKCVSIPFQRFITEFVTSPTKENERSWTLTLLMKDY